jgi:hypothetical protein
MTLVNPGDVADANILINLSGHMRRQSFGVGRRTSTPAFPVSQAILPPNKQDRHADMDSPH